MFKINCQRAETYNNIQEGISFIKKKKTFIYFENNTLCIMANVFFLNNK